MYCVSQCFHNVFKEKRLGSLPIQNALYFSASLIHFCLFVLFFTTYLTSSAFQLNSCSLSCRNSLCLLSCTPHTSLILARCPIFSVYYCTGLFCSSSLMFSFLNFIIVFFRDLICFAFYYFTTFYQFCIFFLYLLAHCCDLFFTYIVKRQFF